MRHAKHGGIHGAAGGGEGLWERTYAYAKRGCECGRADADAHWRAVDGGLLVVLDDDLGAGLLGRRAGGRGVERGWRGVAVDVGVVGDVGEPETARH